MAGLTATIRVLDNFSNTMRQFESHIQVEDSELRHLSSSISNTNAHMDSMGITAGSLTSKLTGLLGAYAGLSGVKALVGLSDEIASVDARLGLVTEDVEGLSSQIYAAAQDARAPFADMANQIAQLGLTASDAFGGSMDNVVAFVSTLNKQFALAGATSQEVAAASLQIKQALQSGVLQGEEYRTLRESAPLFRNALEDYMHNIEGVQGSLAQMASDGELTADRLVKAMSYAADETNERFNKLPMTWDQVMTKLKNTFIRGLDPILAGINWLANNWDAIRPAILGVTAAIGTALIIMGAYKTATLLAAGAQMLLNSTMALTILAISLLVGAIVLLAATWVDQGTTATSTFQVICGWINVVVQAVVQSGQVIGGVFYGIGSLGGAIAHNIAEAFKVAINHTLAGFNGFRSAVMSVIADIAEALSMLPFVEFDAAGLRASADSYAKTAAEQANYEGDYQDLSQAFRGGYDSIAGNAFAPGWVDKAYNGGVDFGAGLTKSFDNAVGSLTGFDMSALAGNTDSIAGNTGSIADSSKRTADAITATDSDLDWLVKYARQNAINKFTTASVTVELGGVTQNINSEVDVDGVLRHMGDKLTEAVFTGAEGVHA